MCLSFLKCWKPKNNPASPTDAVHIYTKSPGSVASLKPIDLDEIVTHAPAEQPVQQTSILPSQQIETIATIEPTDTQQQVLDNTIESNNSREPTLDNAEETETVTQIEKLKPSIESLEEKLEHEKQYAIWKENKKVRFVVGTSGHLFLLANEDPTSTH
jgi:hypothetical protein